MRNFFGNIGDQSFEAMRLTGVGWIFAFLVVGATILAGRLLVGWQMRRLERKFPGYLKPGDEGEPGSGSSGTDSSKVP
jgi:hypothetical protein